MRSRSIILLLAIGASLTLSGCAVSPPDATIPYDAKWEFRETPHGPDGTELPAAMTDAALPWSPLADSGLPPHSGPCGWFRTHVPADEKTRDRVLYLGLSHASLVFVDGRLAYTFGSLSSQSHPGWRGAFVELPPTAATVHVASCTITDSLGFHSSRVGNRGDIYTAVYLRDQPRLTSGVLFAVVGLPFLVLFWRDRRLPYLAFAWTSIATGLHFIGQANGLARPFYLDDRIWVYLLYSGTFFLPAGELLLVQATIGPDRWRVIRALTIAHTVLGITAFVGFGLDLLPIERMNGAGQLLILVSFLTQAPRVMLHAWRGNTDARILGMGLILFALAGLHDIVFARLFDRLTGSLLHLGAFAFLASGATIVVRRFESTSTRLRRYSEDLENLVGQRTSTLQLTLDALNRDLAMARSIQRKTLPASLPEDTPLRIVPLYLPMGEVGGDLYDAHRLPDGRIRLFLMDATGHGLQAALLTMAIKTEYESVKSHSASPGETLGTLNREFTSKYVNLNALFSVILLDIDTGANEIAYASAGHPDQIILTRDGSLCLSRTGGILGMRPSMDIQTNHAPFRPGDRLLLFSDGAFEQFDAAMQEYGEERLHASFSLNRHRPLEELLQRAVTDLRVFLGKRPMQDDVTLLGVEFTTGA